MINTFYFSLALPGAGKTTWINEHFHNELPMNEYVEYMNEGRLLSLGPEDLVKSLYIKDYYNSRVIKTPEIFRNWISGIVVSADDIKPYISGYNPADPFPVHEQSVQLAKQMVENIAMSDDLEVNVFMDGGGVNNHYTENIINFVREHCPKCEIICVYFDTPVEVCVDRISKRERKVPLSSVYEKNQKIIPCLYRYQPLVDRFVRVNYYTNKYILLDMDGTICGYTKARFDIDGNADFVNGELFLHLKPVQHVIDYVKEHYDMKDVYIVTAVANSIAWEEKNKWLDKYFPELPKENRFFCGNKDYKYVFVKQLADHKGWKRNEMVLVDDYHPTIEKCQKVQINCIHPSNIDSLNDNFALFS